MTKELCPCHSKKAYEACCAPYHRGKLPENAMLLMRSRYSAYAKGLADYIMATTHPLSSRIQPNMAKWKEEILEFSNGTVFEDLEIVDFKEDGDRATVVFIAYLKQQGLDATFSERSHFEKIDGRWLYKDGERL